MNCWNCLPKRFQFGSWFETNWFMTLMISTSYMKTNVLFECLDSLGTEFTFIYEEPVPSLHLSYSEGAVTKAVSCCGLCEVIFNLVPRVSHLTAPGGQLDERPWERGWKILLLVDYRSRCRISIEFNLFNSEFDMAELRRVNQVWDGFDLQHFKPCSGSLFIFLEAKSKIMNVVPHAINAVIFNIKTQRCLHTMFWSLLYIH